MSLVKSVMFRKEGVSSARTSNWSLLSLMLNCWVTSTNVTLTDWQSRTSESVDVGSFGRQLFPDYIRDIVCRPKLTEEFEFYTSCVIPESEVSAVSLIWSALLTNATSREMELHFKKTDSAKNWSCFLVRCEKGISLEKLNTNFIINFIIV